MEFTMGAGQVPAGSFVATFVGVEQTPGDQAKGYGPGLKWKFQIQQGPESGKIASRTTGTSPTHANACGKMLLGVLGRTLGQGEKANIANYVGRKYLIVVAPSGANGATRIEAVTQMEN